MYVSPHLRSIDDTDRVLMALSAKMEHERRMRDVREMDIEAWVSEVA